MQCIAKTIFFHLPKTPAIWGNLPTKETSLCQRISQLSAILFFPFLWLGDICSSFYGRIFSTLSPQKPDVSVAETSPKNVLKKDLALPLSEDDVKEELLGSLDLSTPELPPPGSPVRPGESVVLLSLPAPLIPFEKEEILEASSEDEINDTSISSLFCEEDKGEMEPEVLKTNEEITDSSSEDEIERTSLSSFFHEENEGEMESEVLKTSAVAQSFLSEEKTSEIREGSSTKKRVTWAEGIKENEKKPKPPSQPAPKSPRLQSLYSEFDEFLSNPPRREIEKEKEEELPRTIDESSSSSSSGSTNGDVYVNQVLSSIFLDSEQSKAWQDWLSSYDYFGISKTWNWTKDLTYWLRQQIHREPNPIYDKKYELALATQLKSIRKWLASKNILIPNSSNEEENTKSLETYLEKRYKNKRGSLTEGYTSSDWNFVDKVTHSINTLLHPSSVKSVRENNTNLLRALREALTSSSYKDDLFRDLVEILQAICWGKFTSNVMTRYEKWLLEQAIGAPEGPFTAQNIAEMILKSNRALKTCDATLRKAPGDLMYQKLTNELDAYSDPLGTSNIPEIRSIHTVKDLSSSYDIIYMRHGTPTFAPDLSNLTARWTGNVSALVGLDTIDSRAWNKAEIIPEYRGFLDAAKAQGSSILYANHQNMTVVNSAEYNRSIVIEQLQDEYPETFHFIALPFDGPIWQEIEKGTFSDWKDRICSALVNQRDGFRLPKGFAADRKDFAGIIQKIHELYFSSQEELSQAERITFLSIFYSYVKEVIKAKYKVKIMVSACKDNKDRGNASSSIDEALFNLRLGRENDEKALEDLYTRVLSPFIIKYEEILEHRLEPLLLLLEAIAKLSDEEKRKIREYSPVSGYTIQDQRVPYESE